MSGGGEPTNAELARLLRACADFYEADHFRQVAARLRIAASRLEAMPQVHDDTRVVRAADIYPPAPWDLTDAKREPAPVGLPVPGEG